MDGSIHLTYSPTTSRPGFGVHGQSVQKSFQISAKGRKRDWLYEEAGTNSFTWQCLCRFERLHGESGCLFTLPTWIRAVWLSGCTAVRHGPSPYLPGFGLSGCLAVRLSGMVLHPTYLDSGCLAVWLSGCLAVRHGVLALSIWIWDV